MNTTSADFTIILLYTECNCTSFGRPNYLIGDAIAAAAAAAGCSVTPAVSVNGGAAAS